MTLALLALAALPPAAPEVAPEHGADAAVVYRTAQNRNTGEPVELKLHLFLPEGRGARPAAAPPRAAVVFFFGGAWRGGDAGQFAPQARHFARRGLVAAAAEYRVNGREGVGPADCVADARAALHALRNLDRYGVDPNRVAAAGGSAGGHLAACCAYIPTFPGDPDGFRTADAAVLFNPGLICAPYLGPAGEKRGPDGWMTGLLPTAADLAAGATPAEAFSPAHHLDAADPPAAIFHGADDETVPPAGVKLFARAAAAAGARCELYLFPNAGHGFFNYGRGARRGAGPAYATTLRLADDFLTRLGYTPGPPPAGAFPGPGAAFTRYRAGSRDD